MRGLIWSNKAADIATAHVAVGAMMLRSGCSSRRDLHPILRRRTLAAGPIPRSLGPESVRFLMKTAAIDHELRLRQFAKSCLSSDFAELVKARLTLLVLLTTAVGYYLGATPPLNYAVFFHVVFGTALAAAGAAALNQWWEHRLDALMHANKNASDPSRSHATA